MGPGVEASIPAKTRMTILLDTSIIIDALRKRRERRELLRWLLEQGHELACCAVNVAEVYSGMRSHEAEETAALMESLAYVPISREAARTAGELRLQLQRKGKTLSLPDAIIGAVALHEGLTVATDNVRDFSMLRLDLLPLQGA
jgi:tRNA(fMet)-specific endonuclease VapC